ncbi:MAG: pyrimidine-specific ribonucleoside hydrolase [Gammaproteobacteria bacterium]|jgi:pyrimidine-specific ribonucleoside hydrolase
MMGGNLLPEFITTGSEGNVKITLMPEPYYTNTVAEWNVFVDPLDTREIFEGGVPITLVALIATK